MTLNITCPHCQAANEIDEDIARFPELPFTCETCRRDFRIVSGQAVALGSSDKTREQEDNP